MTLIRPIYICLFILYSQSIFASNDLCIGVAGPMTGKGKLFGQEMIEGIQLYVDQMNQSDGTFGNKIHVLIKDDQNDSQKALAIANSFAKNPSIVLVIGHYFSSTSIMAGKVYQKYQIPAITGSATATEVTNHNDWYFRIIPNNAFQAGYIASYINSYLKINRAIIIYDTDTFGISLLKHFEKAAQSSNIEIIHKFSIRTHSNVLDAQIKHICMKIRKTDRPGCIFIATHASEAIKITSLLQEDRNYPLLGSDSFGTYSFINQLPKNDKSLHFAIPYLSDIADREALPFIKAYKKKYQKYPNWVSASYYDAIHLAVDAMKKANLSVEEPVSKKRRKIQKALYQYYNIESSLKGVTGNLYFNSIGDVVKPMKIGIIKNNKTKPSFIQYHLIPPENINYNTLKKTLTGDMIFFQDQVMQKVLVVYTRINILELIEFNINKKLFQVRFDLYLTSNEDIAFDDIQFINTVAPVTIIATTIKKHDSLITKQFQIKGRFRTQLDLKAYPFDIHNLIIRFKHKRLSRDQLVYTVEQIQTHNQIKNHIKNWKIIDYSMYQDSLEDNFIQRLTQNHPERLYSIFNSNIKIRRKGVFQSYKYILFFIVLIVVMALAQSIKNTLLINISLLFSIVSAGWLHFQITKISDAYLIYLEYFIFIIYLFILIIFVKEYVKNKFLVQKRMYI